MKKSDILQLNEKIKEPYEWTEKTIADYTNNQFKIIIIKIKNKNNCYWALNTSKNINNIWIIKKDTKAIDKTKGIDETIKKLIELNNI